MKKLLKVLALVLGLGVMAGMLFACSSGNGDENNGENGGDNGGGNTETTYYLTGSFNNYAVDSADYVMKKLPADHAFYESYPDADLYYFIVPAEDMVPDEVNDGHYYKVTDGSWDVGHNWGTDSYALQPAPVNGSYGLGSIYIPIDYDFGTAGLKVIFDAATKTIYDNTMKREITPRVYGDFHASFGIDKADWSYTDENSFVMTENGDAWEVTLDLPAFTGAEGAYASVSVLWGEMFYIDMGADYDGVQWTQMQWAADATKQVTIAATQADFKQDSPKTYKITLNKDSGEVTVTDITAA